ncbi:50S ribosomal protein L6 [Patescibacteria group bacterium]|nr:50S ribosomal protein L6 [Patescibacteria group bacterium]
MSRIGRQLITIPQGVTVNVTGSQVAVKGPKGELHLDLPSRIAAEIKEGKISVSRTGEDKVTRSRHGAIRALLNNMVAGVVTPWKKELEIRGTGYKAVANGNKLTVTAGYIHPVVINAPAGILFQVAEDTKITVTGCDKIIVGQVASNVRKIKPPEPYKGKGIRYLNEIIKLKAGKTAKA